MLGCPGPATRRRWQDGAVRVVVTRQRDQASELVRRLEELGHDVAVCPLIDVEPTGPATIELGGYDWVVVTSANGARELGRRRIGTARNVAAIGRATATALRAVGIEPQLVASVSTQEGLLAELPRPAGRVLFAGAEGARRLLVDELQADFAPLYRTVELELRRDQLPEADVVLLASASAARAYGAAGAAAPAISIGPETTAAARAAGVRVLAEARTHDTEGLVKAVESVRQA